MFRGISNISLDDKGRLAVPTRYREFLKVHADNQLVITIDTEARCLLLYPLPDWEIIQHKIEALPSFNPAARRIQRLLIGHAADVPIDANGRILVPQALREHANIDKKIVLVGQGKKFEIWDEATWQKQCDYWLTQIDTTTKNLMIKELEALSI